MHSTVVENFPLYRIFCFVLSFPFGRRRWTIQVAPVKCVGITQPAVTIMSRLVKAANSSSGEG
jgi:hypothetical protein